MTLKYKIGTTGTLQDTQTHKLQLEGLAKAGAFDSLNINRKSIFESIPNLILTSKSISENRIKNQIDLFNDVEEKEFLLIRTNDWQFEEKLSKEFEAVGFFISDHPINDYKDIFKFQFIDAHHRGIVAKYCVQDCALCNELFEY